MEPPLPTKIDAHQHFWQFNHREYDWIDPGGVLGRDHLPADLAPLLHAQGMAGTIAVQARQTPKETAWLLALADRTEWIKGVVGWEDLCAPDIEAKLDRWQRHSKLVGFRHVLQDEPDPYFMLRPDVLTGVRAVLARDLVYEILILPRQHHLLPGFLDSVGPGKLVLDHGGKPDIRADGLKDWLPVIERAAQYPHLFCKISGLVTEADHDQWRPDDIDPYLDHLLRCFGPERLVFGTDWPVCQLAATYDQVCSLSRRFIEQRCPDHINQIFGENALRLYGIAGD
jgi:predicted TIM-barrel fold metal-dependent hydrolase